VTIRVHVDGDVTHLILDRGGRRNAIDDVMVTALRDALSACTSLCVVLSSTDPAAFCSGADLRLDDGTRARVSDELYGVYEQMRAYPGIVIAAADGPAVGAGAQLMLASDLRFASPRASLRFPGAGHGLTVGAWGLPGLVGRGRALELCLTMREVGADEALRIGLVERVVSHPVADAVAFAQRLTTLDAAAVRRTKHVVGAVIDGLRMERAGNRATWDGSVPSPTRHPSRDNGM
jgi:enoyl-CoA hydratase/carnithine racemase